jgi:hypothetical protein
MSVIIQENDKVLFAMRSDSWNGTTNITVDEIKESGGTFSLGRRKRLMRMLSEDAGLAMRERRRGLKSDTLSYTWEAHDSFLSYMSNVCVPEIQREWDICKGSEVWYR